MTQPSDLLTGDIGNYPEVRFLAGAQAAFDSASSQPRLPGDVAGPWRHLLLAGVRRIDRL